MIHAIFSPSMVIAYTVLASVIAVYMTFNESKVSDYIIRKIRK